MTLTHKVGLVGDEYAGGGGGGGGVVLQGGEAVQRANTVNKRLTLCHAVHHTVAVGADQPA